MATEFSMLGIMNAALLAQGFQEVASENDGTEEFLALARNWPGIVESELEEGRYNFTKHEAELLTRIDGKFGFADGYLLPASTLHVRKVWILDEVGERCEARWVQDDRYVYVDSEDGCTVETMISKTPDLWSANFVQGVQRKLEAILLRVNGENSSARDMEQQAEVYFQRARTNSSKSRSAEPVVKASRIARARFGRG
jgi:hypothetical protein